MQDLFDYLENSKTRDYKVSAISIREDECRSSKHALKYQISNIKYPITDYLKPTAHNIVQTNQPNAQASIINDRQHRNLRWSIFHQAQRIIGKQSRRGDG